MKTDGLQLHPQPWMNEISADILPEPYRRMFSILGVEVTLKIAAEFQGMNVYFPKLDGTLKTIRDRRIRDEFNGHNVRELARRFGLTETWIRQILAENPTESNQGDLFEEESESTF